ERHLRAQLDRMDARQYLLGSAPFEVGEYACALSQARAECRMSQVGRGFIKGADRVPHSRRAVAEPCDLGEYEPHPVAGLASGAQLGDGALIRAAGVLGDDEP